MVDDSLNEDNVDRVSVAGPSTPMNDSEVQEDDPVLDAINHRDWESLRKLSLVSGGFGSRRKEAWSFLLNSTSSSSSGTPPLPENTSNLRHRRRTRTSSASNDSDPDESFVSASSDIKIDDNPTEHPDERQIKLDTDRSFVSYPVDVITPRDQLQSSLNKLINAVFRRRPKLSYFQGYHDIMTVIFLTLPEDEQLRCAEHISLHRLRDSMGKGLEPLIGLLRVMKYLLRLVDPAFAALIERAVPLPYFALSNLLTLFSHDVPTLPQIQHVFDFLLCRPPIMAVYLAAAFTLTRKEEAVRLEEEGEEGMLHSLLSGLPDIEDEGDSLSLSAKEKTVPPSREMDPTQIPLPESTATSLAGSKILLSDEPSIEAEASSFEEQVEEKILNQVDATLAEEIALPTSSPGESQPNTDEDLPPSPPHHTPSPIPTPSPTRTSSPSQPHVRRPQVLLPTILTHADTLYTLYPPTHPSLHLSSIMGPQSVIFTWNEDPARMESDDQAENIVGDTTSGGVVLPYEGSDAEPDSDDEEHEEDELEDEKHSKAKSRHGHRRRRLRDSLRWRKGQRRGEPNEKDAGGLFAMDKKTVVAGVVLVTGIAIAVYGAKYGGLGKHGRNGEAFEWRKVGQLIGGAFIGMGEKFLGG